jgi:hypothetical protein
LESSATSTAVIANPRDACATYSGAARTTTAACAITKTDVVGVTHANTTTGDEVITKSANSTTLTSKVGRFYGSPTAAASAHRDRQGSTRQICVGHVEMTASTASGTAAIHTTTTTAADEQHIRIPSSHHIQRRVTRKRPVIKRHTTLSVITSRCGCDRCTTDTGRGVETLNGGKFIDRH